MTIGKIIDLFSGSEASTLPVSIPTAAAILALFFAIGAGANMTRTILMRISGQRIVARLRESAYQNVLRQVRQIYKTPRPESFEPSADFVTVN